MKDTFNLQDAVFDLFKVDVELLGLLGDPIGDDELNNKIRRETFDDSQLDASTVNFVSFFFLDTGATENYLVNKGLLQFDLYCDSRYSAQRISTVIKRILNDNFEDFKVVFEGQRYAFNPSIYKYAIRVKPLITAY